jgi:hypothetical protein
MLRPPAFWLFVQTARRSDKRRAILGALLVLNIAVTTTTLVLFSLFLTAELPIVVEDTETIQ